MGKWVLTVAGISILSVLCDIVLPDGQTRKYVKTVFGVVVTLVIVQPLIGLLNTDINEQAMTNIESSVQQKFIENVNEREAQVALNQAKLLIESNGIDLENAVLASSEKKVMVTLNERKTSETEFAVRSAIGRYLPNYDLIIIWVR